MFARMSACARVCVRVHTVGTVYFILFHFLYLVIRLDRYLGSFHMLSVVYSATDPITVQASSWRADFDYFVYLPGVLR